MLAFVSGIAELANRPHNYASIAGYESAIVLRLPARRFVPPANNGYQSREDNLSPSSE